jgi:4-diphosphocytidyl-2-C-methyl-D-erythritol kinase
MTRVTVQAPAKVNLALHVTARRPDGYHEIETVAVFAAICDSLTAEPATNDSLVIDGPFAGSLSDDGDNLVLRARDGLRRAAVAEGLAAGPVSLRLEKNLPVASGMGGGSADAAATLLALARLWRLPAGFGLHEIAVRLGADVPMCLASRPLLASGVGEKLVPVELPSPLHAVLANPGVAVPTRDVFARLAKRDNGLLGPVPAKGITVEWLKGLRNDLQEPAASAFPVIADALRRISGCGGIRLVRMSGSGATCFGLFDDAGSAAEAAAAIGRSHPGWWCVATRFLPGEYPARVQADGD